VADAYAGVAAASTLEGTVGALAHTSLATGFLATAVIGFGFAEYELYHNA
jgi:hypothetical protein